MPQTGRPEKGAEYYDRVYSQPYDVQRYFPIYMLAVSWTTEQKDPTVLEVGCGIGKLGSMFEIARVPYRGFDISQVAVDKAKKTYPTVDYHVGDLYDPEMYRVHDFNTVIAIETLEHVDDIRFLKLLPPKTRVIASVPNFDWESHVRIYTDFDRDVVDRYRGTLDILRHTSLRGKGSSNVPIAMHVFEGITR